MQASNVLQTLGSLLRLETSNRTEVLHAIAAVLGGIERINSRRAYWASARKVLSCPQSDFRLL